MESPSGRRPITRISEVRVDRLRWKIGMYFHRLRIETNVITQQPLAHTRTSFYNVYYSKSHLFSSLMMSLTPTAAFLWHCRHTVKRLRLRGGLLPAAQAGVEHTLLKYVALNSSGK